MGKGTCPWSREAMNRLHYYCALWKPAVRPILGFRACQWLSTHHQVTTIVRSRSAISSICSSNPAGHRCQSLEPLLPRKATSTMLPNAHSSSHVSIRLFEPSAGSTACPFLPSSLPEARGLRLPMPPLNLFGSFTDFLLDPAWPIMALLSWALEMTPGVIRG